MYATYYESHTRYYLFIQAYALETYAHMLETLGTNKCIRYEQLNAGWGMNAEVLREGTLARLELERQYILNSLMQGLDLNKWRVQVYIKHECPSDFQSALHMLCLSINTIYKDYKEHM